MSPQRIFELERGATPDLPEEHRYLRFVRFLLREVSIYCRPYRRPHLTEAHRVEILRRIDRHFGGGR